MKTMEQVWEQALDRLKGNLSPENFETWLRPVQFGGIVNDALVLRIPNQFFAEWIAAHYLDLIIETLQTEAGEAQIPKKVQWELDDRLREVAQAARESTPPPAPRAPRANIDSRTSSSALRTSLRTRQASPAAPIRVVAITLSSSMAASG